MDDVEVWDKRTSETSLAFQAFRLYRDLGAARSISKVARLVKKHAVQLREWSSLHDWVARVHAWDIHLDRENQAQQQRDQVEMLQRHAKAMVDVQNKAIAALKKLKPDDLTTNDVIRYLEVAQRGERLARGVGGEQEDKGKTAYLTLWERLGGDLPATGTEGK